MDLLPQGLMKVLIFYTYNKGPLSNFFEELSTKLVQKGYEVTNFFLKHRKEHFSINGIEIFGEKRGGYFSNYLNTYRIIKQTKPDIIISNFSYVNPALLFGKLLGVKRNLCWFHTVWGHSRPGKLKVFNKKMHLKMADAIIANSMILKGELHSIYDFNKEQIYAIPFWTTISNFDIEEIDVKRDPSKDTLLIGCPGRLVKDKNHSIVIDAIKDLSKRTHKTIILYIAGSGDYEADLREKVRSEGLSNHVNFLGLLSTSQMLSFYKQMDLVVLPSLNEAFGLVFIESISLGTPVIVSSQFGSLAYIDKQEFDMNRFTFDPRSKEDLIEKLELFINSQMVSEGFFTKLYKQTFDKEVIFKKIEHVIQNTTNNTGIS